MPEYLQEITIIEILILGVIAMCYIAWGEKHLKEEEYYG